MSTTQDLLLRMLESPSFGGPHSVRVSVDGGPTGQRGTFIFLSPGDPNISPIINTFPDENGFPIPVSPSEIQRFDICLSLVPDDPSSLIAFSYQDGEQGLRWYPTVRLAPEGFAKNQVVEFESGVGIMVLLTQLPPFAESAIASASLASGFNLEAYLNSLESQILNTLNVNVTVENENPVTLSIIPDPETESPVLITYSGSSPRQYSAIITEDSREIILRSGNTSTISLGQQLFKQDGVGEFGESPIVTSITSNTRFTVSSSHLASGVADFTSKSADVLLTYLVSASELDAETLQWSLLNGEKILHTIVAVVTP